MSNDFDTADAVDAYLRTNDTAENARRATTLALGTDPDFEAELRHVAAKTGVPIQSVRAFPDETKQQARLASFDFGEMAQQYPTTAKFLADLGNAQLAHDDVYSLQSFERTATEKLLGLSRGLSAAGNFGSGMAGRAWKGFAYNLPAGFWGAAASPFEATSQGLEAAGVPSWAAGSELGSAFRWLSSLAKRSGDAMQLPAPQGNLEAGLASGFESLGANLPLLPLGAAMQSFKVPTALMSIVSGGSSYIEARDQGAGAAKALSLAIPDTVAEYATEQYGMKALFDIPGVQTGVGALLKGAANFMAKEGVGEQVATVWQDFNDWAVMHPEKTMQDYLRERPDAAIQTAIATVVGGGGQVALVSAVNSFVDTTGAAQRAAPAADALAELGKIAGASKLTARDVDTAAGFFQAALGEGNDSVWLSPQALAQTGLGQRLAEAVPGVAEQIDAAVTAGHDLRLSIADLMARVPGEELQALTPHLAMEPGGYTQTTAQEYLQSGAAQELQAQVERILSDQRADEAFRRSADTVTDNIKAQLDTASRFTPQVNDAYAAMVGSFYSATAARLGIPPDQLLAQYPLKIAAEGVGAYEQGPYDDLLKSFDGGATKQAGIKPMSEEDTKRAEAEFLSAFPEGSRYPHDTRLLERVRQASLHAADQLGNNPETPRVLDRTLGPFSVYRTEGVVLPGDSFSPDGRLEIRVFGKEQTEAGYLAEPALTFTVSKAGELTVNGPMPSGETFAQFSKKGWADRAKGAEGEVQIGWSALRDPARPGRPLPVSQVLPLLADVHARAREWRQQDRIGLHWGRATGALGGLFGENPTAVFFQGSGTRGAFNPETLQVTLLKNADLSTFLHESGHFFLEVMADLAARPDAPAQVQADMAKLLKWFGVPDLATWTGLGLEEKRAYHEQFARGFEAYLFEGRAPSIELHSLFQRFRDWLVAVYQSLKALAVEMTPEVRSVFDRMLATEEQIALAEQGRSMMPLFRTAEQAGMTPEEFAAYQGHGVDATADAIRDMEARGLRDMRWLRNSRDKILHRLQQDAKEARAEMQLEARREVMQQPIYQAWQFLTAEGTEGGSPVGKLNTDAVSKVWMPTENAQRLHAYKMTSGEGLHPDVVADLFGFSSGDELVRNLATADTPAQAVEALTDQRMLERYGELSSPQAIERAADRAIHNEARARMVATEANALEQAIGKRKTLAALARQYAAAMVGRLKVRDIRPSQYANAEARAARAAEKASRAGDVATAAAEKRVQLVQLYATRAAHDAQDTVVAGLRYLRKFDSGKNLDPGYRDQIAALLERFDVSSGQTNKSVDKRIALAEWITAQRDLGVEPDIPVDLQNEAFRKSYKEMTVEEFRGLVDTIKQIEHLGRLKHKLLTAKGQRDYEVVRDEITASIREHAGGREADTRTPTTNAGRAVQGLRRFWASHIKAATLARVMDGGRDGGPVWEYLVRTANERGDLETSMRANATVALSQIMAPVLRLGRMGGSGQYFSTVARSLNRETRIAIALNWGNSGNRQRLLGGEGWTEQQVLPVLKSLTAQEWAAVQAVWDHFESYRPQIAEKEKRVYGKEPEWVEPAPFAVTTADGHTVQLRGGYYPIKYDPAASQRAEEHADAEGAKRQLHGAYTSATTRRSFTKTRVEEVAGRPLLYTLAGLYSGVNDVIHDLAWHEWLIDANRLLRSKHIDAAIREHYGPEAKAQLKAWAQDIAEGEKGHQAALDAALGRLRQGVSAAGLGFNVMSAAIQPLGITQSIVRIGAQWAGRGLAKYIAHPVHLTQDVVAKSSFMEQRSRTRFRELNELRNQVQDQGAFNEYVGRYAYWLMMRCQQMVDVPTWWGAYEKAIAIGNDEARAIALADQAVIDSQGSGMVKDTSAIERGGPAQKLFTVFYSFMNTALNLGVAQSMTQAKRGKWAAEMLLLYTVPPVLGYFFKEALTPGGGDDDDLEALARKLAAEQLSYLMGLVVVAREFGGTAKTLTGAEGMRGYEGPAGLRFIPDLFRFGTQVSQGEFDDAFRKSAVSVIGDMFGLPAAQINRSITGGQALAGEETDNPAALIFGYRRDR